MASGKKKGGFWKSLKKFGKGCKKVFTSKPAVIIIGAASLAGYATLFVLFPIVMIPLTPCLLGIAAITSHVIDAYKESKKSDAIRKQLLNQGPVLAENVTPPAPPSPTPSNPLEAVPIVLNPLNPAHSNPPELTGQERPSLHIEGMTEEVADKTLSPSTGPVYEEGAVVETEVDSPRRSHAPVRATEHSDLPEEEVSR